MYLKSKYIIKILFFVFLFGYKGIGQQYNIKLTDTSIKKGIDYFDDTIKNFYTREFTDFHDSVFFIHATFLNDADFSFAKFQKPADFSDATFTKDADFYNSEFFKDVKFDANQFFETANFISSKFKDYASFFYVVFFKKIEFEEASFLQDAYFNNTEFLDDVDFSKATFSKDASFAQTKFSKDIDFYGTTFNTKLFLNNLSISDTTEFNFQNSRLPDTLDFSYNFKINKEIDFTTAALNDSSRYGDYNTKTIKPVMIFLYKTDISKLHLDYIHFKLLLPDSTLDYPKEFISNTEKIIIYQSLLENFKAHGDQYSYDLLNNEFQEWKINQLSLVDRLWSIYFLKASNVFRITILTFLFFIIINIFFYRKLNNEVYCIEHFDFETQIPKKVNFFYQLLIKFFNSLIYTGIIFFGFSLNFDKIHFKNKGMLIWFCIIYITGLLILFLLTHLLFR